MLEVGTLADQVNLRLGAEAFGVLDGEIPNVWKCSCCIDGDVGEAFVAGGEALDTLQDLHQSLDLFLILVLALARLVSIQIRTCLGHCSEKFCRGRILPIEAKKDAFDQGVVADKAGELGPDSVLLLGKDVSMDDQSLEACALIEKGSKSDGGLEGKRLDPEGILDEGGEGGKVLCGGPVFLGGDGAEYERSK